MLRNNERFLKSSEMLALIRLEKQMMKITEVKVYTVKNREREKRLCAYATIVFDNCFIVRDLKIVKGVDGLFISMPSRRSKFGTFRDIAHPLNAAMRGEIERAIFAEYDKVVNQNPSGEGQSENFEDSYDME